MPPPLWRSRPRRPDGWTRFRPPRPITRSLLLFDSGDEVAVQAGRKASGSCLSQEPLEEPVAWYGPIVMNTQGQLREASKSWNGGLS